MKKIPDPNKMKRIKKPVLKLSELRRAKVRITTYLDEDVIQELRKLAEHSGGKYQAVLNQILRNYFYHEKEGLVARIERLEGAVFQSA